MKGIGLISAGIEVFAILIVLALLAPMFNVIITMMIGATSDQFNQLLIQLIFPALVISAIFILHNVVSPSQQVNYE